MNNQLENSSKNLNLKSFRYRGETYYRNKRNIFNSILEKFENSYFELENPKMSEALKKATESFMNALVSEIFEKFDGKVVGKDFSVEDCVKILVEMPDDSVPATPAAPAKKKKKKGAGRKSGYNMWIADNKAMLNEKIEEIAKATGEEKKKVPMIAGPIWKGLDKSVHDEYNKKAKEYNAGLKNED